MQINHFETENGILVTLAPLSTQIHSIILRDRCLFERNWHISQISLAANITQQFPRHTSCNQLVTIISGQLMYICPV